MIHTCGEEEANKFKDGSHPYYKWIDYTDWVYEKGWLDWYNFGWNNGFITKKDDDKRVGSK